ncbi:MAG: hypothetical protein HQK69_10710 [Desulfamplus sp.]|nr:hypothetical protein [Desulfamplus sp.]
MLPDLIKQYARFISSWQVYEYDKDGPNLRLKSKIVFVDKNEFHIRQVIIDNKFFKYAYHLQTEHGELISRWDNANHWPEIKTHPHHKHVQTKEGEDVQESFHGGDLKKIFQEITQRINRLL